MKFLISSNGPNAYTGYGVQCALLADRLTLAGHQVAVACNYGQQIGMGVWTTPHGHQVPLYWEGAPPASADILIAHAKHWFNDDPTAGWIILLNDVWAINEPQLADWQTIAWTPVDHLTVPHGVYRFLDTTKAIPVAMSRHGMNAMTAIGLDPVYIPLAIDTNVYKPTYTLEANGRVHNARDYFDIPRDAFVVGMVAMNKGWVFDRKGFSEALAAFAVFHQNHPQSILWLHTAPTGYDGINLRALCTAAGIPEWAVKFTNQYAYTHGFTAQMMAALYTSFDVLLAPSHGEGFCVPMVEAQACGTAVIVSNATAQTELMGVGGLVDGQPVWDNSQTCAAFMPSIPSIIQKLEEAFAADLAALSDQAVEFAGQYDADNVFDTYWAPFLKTLEAPEPAGDKPIMDQVAVIVPAMRPENMERLVSSFHTSNDGTATLHLIVDPENRAAIIDAAAPFGPLEVHTSSRGHTFAQKANVGYDQTTEDWILLAGDDCEFKPGFVEAARLLSDRYDVIGTNDTDGRVKNPDVAAKRHADHWFTRRTYIDDEGSSLEGPGILAPEAYNHWYVDKEIIGLAKARGVFTACLDSIVVHHHPGYDGDEAARKADPVYMAAVENHDHDRIQFMRRVGLIEQQRVSRGR